MQWTIFMKLRGALVLSAESWRGPAVAASSALPFALPVLFLVFLKIGAVLYASGYVLLAFLRADLVVRLGWITERQLLDAVSAGQVTPGPLFTSATFIGYLLGSLPGAMLATLDIFLPAFIFLCRLRSRCGRACAARKAQRVCWLG